MSDLTTYNFWKKLLEFGTVPKKSVPKVVLTSAAYKAFYNELPNGALISKKSGRGSLLEINNEKRHLILQFFNETFPESTTNLLNKSDSQAMFRNSKAYKTEANEQVILLRGSNDVLINNKNVNLKSITEQYQVSAFIAPKIEFEKICIVENKDVFMKIEKILGLEFIFLHCYGRVGEKVIRNLIADEILICPDYDFVGLNEYLKFKSIWGQKCKLYVPKDFEYLFERYSTSLPLMQRPSKRVIESKEEIVVYIRNLIQRNNRFLEQQILLRDYES